jgi:hypothetical protein
MVLEAADSKFPPSNDQSCLFFKSVVHEKSDLNASVVLMYKLNINVEIVHPTYYHHPII